MKTFFERIVELHPHAAVAWDRAQIAVTVPDGDLLVVSWKESPGFRESGIAWSNSTGSVIRGDGLGAVVNTHWPCETSGVAFRHVLVRDDKSELGVRWEENP